MSVYIGRVGRSESSDWRWGQGRRIRSTAVRTTHDVLGERRELPISGTSSGGLVGTELLSDARGRSKVALCVLSQTR